VIDQVGKYVRRSRGGGWGEVEGSPPIPPLPVTPEPFPKGFRFSSAELTVWIALRAASFA